MDKLEKMRKRVAELCVELTSFTVEQLWLNPDIYSTLTEELEQKEQSIPWMTAQIQKKECHLQFKDPVSTNCLHKAKEKPFYTLLINLCALLVCLRHHLWQCKFEIANLQQVYQSQATGVFNYSYSLSIFSLIHYKYLRPVDSGCGQYYHQETWTSCNGSCHQV